MRNLLLAVLLAASFLLAGCSSSNQQISQGGSSTVLPIAEAWSAEFGDDVGASIVVTGGGTGTGISNFCKGELDIADASRPIKAEETADCEAKGIEPFEVQVAIDGIAVVAHKDLEFLDCLTVGQLHDLWTADGASRATTWQDLDPAWPDAEVRLFGPGTDSGTYDYWNEAIIHPIDGKEAATHGDYTASENDNTLVNGVTGTANSLGFFGLAYYKERAGQMRLVKVDGGAGCVEPTDANVASGTYDPLSRPLFMYVNGKPEGALKAYFELALGEEGQALVAEVGYIPLPEATRAAILQSIGA